MTQPAHRTGRTANAHPRATLLEKLYAIGRCSERMQRAVAIDAPQSLYSGELDLLDDGIREILAVIEAMPEIPPLNSAPDTLKALKKIRLWLAVEGCWEQVEIVDDALVAAGETHVACLHCAGAGEWDEGPLPATSSAQISPDYRQVKCPECSGTGRVSLTVSRVDGPQPGLTDAEQKAQGLRCGCLGSDDYCVCQNVPDFKTKAARAALSASRSTGDQS